MKAYWQKFSLAFNGLARRERAFCLLAVLAVMYLLWSWVFLAPVGNNIEELRAQRQHLESRTLDMEAQIAVFTEAVSRDPNAAKKRQIKQLQQQLDALDEQLQALAVGLVPAELLPQVLHDVLANTDNLELLGMQTLPVERLTLTESKGSANVAADGEAVQEVDVFRHAVELKVRGGYFAVADYLQALEALQWRFYWDRLDYRVDAYPMGVATLQVYTLSAGEGVLGE